MIVNRTMTLRLWLVPIGLAALLAGCVQQPVEPGGGGRVVRTSSGGEAEPTLPDGPTPPNAIEATDPIASRLHDLSGLLLEYYLLNKRMPPRLDDLKPLADPGQPTDFADPRTGQPFIYNPAATRMSPGDTRLVIHAPNPDSSGRYQGVLMRLARGGQVTATWVVTMSAIELQGHVARIPSTPPATARAP